MQSRDDTTHAGHAALPHGPVVLFDGVCGLCDRFVSFMLRIDRRGRYRFAPLQGETARAYLSGVEPPPDSIVLRAHGRLYFRSGAVLRILAGLGGVWRVAGLLLLVPPPLRNAAYDYIAARRYGWFGKYDACRLPTPEQAHRFLD